MQLDHPITGVVLSDGFGPRDPVHTKGGSTGSFHYGQDYAARAGTPIYAAADGVVTQASFIGTYGYVVYIDHGDMLTRYAHQLEQPRVTVGQLVQRGDLIGQVGSTGASTGPHLHFEVLLNGVRVNPLDHISNSISYQKGKTMYGIQQAGLPDSGVIIGAGQPPRARMYSVFVAECAGLGITPVTLPDWHYGTIVREAWTDFNTTAHYLALAINGKAENGSVTAPLGVSSTDAEMIAKAVADEQAKRLQS